jgi:hypothetical protein
MSDARAAAVTRALKGMAGYPPEPLLEEVNHRLSRDGESLTEPELVDLVTTSDPNDPARMVFHIQLSRWESVDQDTWTAGNGVPTLPGSAERRVLVLSALALGAASAARIGDVFPLHEAETVVISDTPADWDPWYTADRASERTFYWDAYRSVLEQRLDAYAVDRLDSATREVVRRLADPTRHEPYQSKGLVVGHVQSGKTANFTGVIAKAVDAGYRLVIVLTGTIEILRSQTQRRIDMELVGEENILAGIQPDDTRLLAEVDYVGVQDRDWVEGRFLRHGRRPKDVGAPEIRRLTGSRWDYKSLQAGLSALDFRSGNELAYPARPLFDELNLHGTDMRIAVVKKNKAVLTKLVDDLQRIHTRLTEIPVLIIDDEADQASVNTKRERPSAEDRERSAINGKIAELLKILTRAQYVGYTATPFANVFVDPDDSEDIYPKDFIISLEPPTAYMGGRDFHDLDLDPADEKTVASSNELAFVRDLQAHQDEADERHVEMRRALDSYVLAGAIKLWRVSAGGSWLARHHTMLIHESVRQVEHSALAEFVHRVWRAAGYSTPGGSRRLYDLWRDDFYPVSLARAGDQPVPANFGELRPYIGEALDRIQSGSSPIAVINGDKDADYAQPDLDFQRGDVWKILVGGTKLSRGFTVEGLTTTYYTRRTQAADTLMQMGRWFGYREGYKDLVRLFVGRNVPGPRDTRVDLYKAFEAVVRDEEDFRAELRSYQGLGSDGRPRVRPIDVPPMVFQSLPGMKPTGTNKMYNAVLTFKGEGGKVKDFFQQPPRRAPVNRSHFKAVQPLLDAATVHGTFFSQTFGVYRARYGIVSAEVLREVVEQFTWNEKFDFGPTKQFMDQAAAEGTLAEWVVLLPLLSGPTLAQRKIGDLDGNLPILERTRRDDRDSMFSGSSPRQRMAMEIISGGVNPAAPEASEGLRKANSDHPDAGRLHAPGRGAFLLSFAADTGSALRPNELPQVVDPGDVATLFSLAFPKASAPRGRIGFTVVVQGSESAIVDRPD